MRTTRKELTYFWLGFTAFILILGIAGCSDHQATPKQTPTVTSTTGALDRPIDYPATDPCSVLAYIRDLDSANDYAITHAIISANGQEDTLNVSFENGEECEGY